MQQVGRTLKGATALRTLGPAQSLAPPLTHSHWRGLEGRNGVPARWTGTPRRGIGPDAGTPATFHIDGSGTPAPTFHTFTKPPMRPQRGDINWRARQAASAGEKNGFQRCAPNLPFFTPADH
ncbi:hypothetical protein GCM10011491_41510 [Brucella endophytica]|uniref:Uncharacterized protein n=1 Tax=Brucella endophytica TaxID=1963359 RepID=A0A916SR52_9HYPH|nr:hypothetical protein GCM10011491_41510 [Brucella endophytica]